MHNNLIDWCLTIQCALYLFQLLDTKTADKKLTLMHFLVDTVQEKFPEVLNFESELRFIEKAALGIYI